MPYYYSWYSDYRTQYWRARRLEQENTRLSNEKSELERQLMEKTRAAQVSSSQVSTLGYKVRELERQNSKLSGELVKQREDTRKAGLLFMNAADTYQQEAKKQIRTMVEELANTRKAGLLLMNAADIYQEVARKQIKAKVKELEDARKAVLVLMSAADTYQQVAKKQIKDKVEELKVMGAQKAEMDARAASLESRLMAALAKNQEMEADYHKVKDENDKLRSEVERLMMELGKLVQTKEPAAQSFDAEMAASMKELENLEMKVEETQASKDLMKGENDNLQSKDLIAEQKYSLFDAKVERVNMELGALAEAVVVETMKDLGGLKGNVKGNPSQGPGEG
uniref:Uncharacterized protein n=1 Tax=Arundo donax TaxID=35708 RepID=A0A0A9CY68_ARUDO